MSIVGRSTLIASAVALGGCVLLIDPIDPADHCGIAGSGACAQCIKTSCTASIDACCQSTECAASSILGDIDACGRDEVDACLGTLSSGRITKTEEAVRFCASAQCRNVCTVGATSTGAAPRAKWTCATAREPVNDCATCIYESCGTKLDSCCADSSCKDDTTIGIDVGACISGDTRGCAYGQTDARSTSGQAGVVRACILDKCKGCVGNGSTHTDCTLLNGGKYCQCTPSETAGDQSCTPADVGGDCLEAKKGCACGQYVCGNTSTGCACSFTASSGNPGEGTSCAAQSSSSSGTSSPNVCCVKLHDTFVSCSCDEYTTKCYDITDEYEVTSCDRSDVLAYLANLVTSSCSR